MVAMSRERVVEDVAQFAVVAFVAAKAADAPVTWRMFVAIAALIGVVEGAKFVFWNYIDRRIVQNSVSGPRRWVTELLVLVCLAVVVTAVIAALPLFWQQDVAAR